ncbi:GNAT family N-acetyltransferase [Halopiger goleimassiliensis]|uniref:GNAT family N-acetyltransferase n=1 Tax=Halopiger goleimassiliensis TaxID=1293048 RepID=UPI000677C329|nr:GNAT family N-acetyltransferase [Halopiger goleimassiliensis]
MVDVRVADDETDREAALDVRHAVFVEEQGVDPDLEIDEHDPDATHFVAVDGDQAVGAARLRTLEESDAVGTVERVAVLESRRGEGIGRRLMAAVEREAAAMGLETVTLHSQTHAADFYDRLGYERSSDVFEEAGIPHVEMRKSVSVGDRNP